MFFSTIVRRIELDFSVCVCLLPLRFLLSFLYLSASIVNTKKNKSFNAALLLSLRQDLL